MIILNKSGLKILSFFDKKEEKIAQLTPLAHQFR